MTVSRFRPINWNKEDRILRDDMPREFRNLLEELKSHHNSRAEIFALALEGLGAMTYAVAIGTAAAQLGERRAELLAALQKPSHQKAVGALDTQEHYVQICLAALPDLLRSVDVVTKEFTGILNDICLIHASPRLSPQELLKRFKEFRETGASLPRREISQLNNRLYDLVSSIFGYWPKYALGYLDHENRRVCFDTDELGKLTFRPAEEANQFRFSVKGFPANFERLAKKQQAAKERSNEHAPIDVRRLRSVFLADSNSKRIWMISPFVLNYRPSAESEDSEYLFLDPTWSGAHGVLTWRRFNSSLDRLDRAQRGTALAAQIKGDGGNDAVRSKLLSYPREVELSDAQGDEVFHFLENELRKVEFRLDDGRTYRVSENDDRRRIFYKTGASLFVEVTAGGDQQAGPIAVAKVLQDPRRGIYGFEEQRFRAETAFLETYFSDWDNKRIQPRAAGAEPSDDFRIGAGIVRSIGHGLTEATDELGAAFAKRPFVLHEFDDRSLRDVIDYVAPEAPPEDRRLADIWWARRMMRALYITERAAATLALIYEKTTSNACGKEVHFIHRDIRPEIILHLGAGIIKICDFSAAFFPGGNEQVVFLENEDYDGMQNNVILDSYGMSSHYCAPEVYDRPNAYSNTADVFSLGIVLNEMLFGHKKNVDLGRKKNVQRTVTDWQIGREHDANWGSLLFDPPDKDAERVCAAIEKFAASAPSSLELVPDRNNRYFDLKGLIGDATCHWHERLTMEAFRNRVAATSHLIRHYLATLCRAVIAESFAHGSAESLEYALRCASSVFGQHREVRKPLAMVRCAVCHQCDRYEYDVDIARYSCHAGGMRTAILDLEKVVGAGRIATAETEGRRVEISYSEARKALEAIDKALEICPGIMDRVPEELYATLDEKKLAPHVRFHEIGFNLFKPSGIDELSVVWRDETGKPPIRPPNGGEDDGAQPLGDSGLAAELIRLFVRAAAAGRSQIRIQG